MNGMERLELFVLVFCYINSFKYELFGVDDDIDEIVVDDATGDVEIELVFDDVVNDDTPTNGLLLVVVVELLAKQ